MTPCQMIAKVYRWMDDIQEREVLELSFQTLPKYFPIWLLGIHGTFSVLLNGYYIPVYNNYTNEIVYKKEDNSKMTIQYCDKLCSWKAFDQEKGTLARISAVTFQKPLDQINRTIYWEVYDDKMNKYEIQPFARTSLIA
jgi:hypothetical protein